VGGEREWGDRPVSLSTLSLLRLTLLIVRASLAIFIALQRPCCGMEIVIIPLLHLLVIIFVIFAS
jgi:hypothetical protein